MKLLSTVVLVLVSTAGYCQIEDSTDFKITRQDRIRFTFSPGNYAYIGVENPFTFRNPGLTGLLFYCKDGRIRTSEQGFIFDAHKAGKLTIHVYKLNNGDSTAVYYQDIMVRRIPDPTVAIKDIQIKGEIKKELFTQAKTLDGYLDIDIEWLKRSFEIKSFTLRIVSGTTALYHSESNKFTPEMMRAFSKLKKGDTLSFEDMLMSGPDGTTRGLGEHKCRIK